MSNTTDRPADHDHPGGRVKVICLNGRIPAFCAQYKMRFAAQKRIPIAAKRSKFMVN